jgi:alkylation response protein AidB-like acyl-CoA dehydrogenase
VQNAEALLAGMRAHAAALAGERATRQRRRNLDPADFRTLRDLGLPLATVPVGDGGWWEGAARSMRTLCDAYRILAGSDASLALAASMHPSVLAHWRDPAPPSTGGAAWRAQQRAVFATVVDGAWWGTITSEPGSGGDIGRTRTRARRDREGYRLTGEKHFGSGSGVTSFVLTAAVPEGEREPCFFFLDVREVPWDGSRGMKLVAEWDGHGMAATNSHGFVFEDFPATRLAWPGSWRTLNEAVGGGGGIVYTAVVVGVVEAAMAYTRDYLRRRGVPESLGAFEQVEWAAAYREAWLMRQALEGAMLAFEQHGEARQAVALAKANIAVLAEQVLTRLCRIAGGGAYARHSPLGFWFEDVRALGFLRPPWAVASDRLFEMSWEARLGA